MINSDSANNTQSTPTSKDSQQSRQFYFVGAGGIGMANLVRYFLAKGAKVAGYDLHETALTRALQQEGATITYIDDDAEIPTDFLDSQSTIVVYTPAVPEDNKILSRFRNEGHKIIKRAALLGRITHDEKGICVAGSHGKTTTCSMIAHILHSSSVGCNAFLGGILRNYNTNLLIDKHSDFAVIEADEYDRSFHHLSPFIAVVTSVDPDHLDIYGDEQGYLEGFRIFTSLIRPDGFLIIRKGLRLRPDTPKGVKTFYYSTPVKGENTADYRAENIRYNEGKLYLDLYTPDGVIEALQLGTPIEINVENAVAASAAALLAGVREDELRRALASFQGAHRRFEIWLDGTESPRGTILVDDYAHSPAEIAAAIASIRKLWSGKRISVIFQPHLYTRTRDFAPEFGQALSAADEVILPEIYPARELPIPGISSNTILQHVKIRDKKLCDRKDLLELIKNSNFEILITLGAADIDIMLPQIAAILKE